MLSELETKIKTLEMQSELESKIKTLEIKNTELLAEINRLKCPKNPKIDALNIFCSDTDQIIYGEKEQLEELMVSQSNANFKLSPYIGKDDTRGSYLKFTSIASTHTALLRHGYKFIHEYAVFYPPYNYHRQLWTRTL